MDNLEIYKSGNDLITIDGAVSTNDLVNMYIGDYSAGASIDIEKQDAIKIVAHLQAVFELDKELI